MMIGAATNAQPNFTVTCSSPFIGNNYIKPMKAGSSIQFQIKVKNNNTVTYTVSIDKNAMPYGSWLQIDNNSLTLPPNQEVIFQLTLTVPTGTSDLYTYSFPFYFNAYYNGYNNQYSWTTLTLIVDNAPPTTPTVSAPNSWKTSTSITVQWNSSDSRSAVYTAANPTSGINGIKSYTVNLYYSDGTLKESKAFPDATATNNSCTFSNLFANTGYSAFVTAVDLATNASTNTGLPTSTPPAKPANLTSGNTAYGTTTLSWTASAGATSYDVYNASTYVKVNTSPITTNSFTISNLTPNTSYTYYIYATSSAGTSDRSSNITITTPALPPTTGSQLVCSSGVTYSVVNLISGYTTSWSKSSNLYFAYSYGSNAVFVANGSGAGWVNATITSPTGQSFTLSKIDVWVGPPLVNLISGPQYVDAAQLDAVYSAQPYSSLAVATYNWQVSPSYYTLSSAGDIAWISFPYDGDYWVSANAQNACGTSSTAELFVSVGIYEPYIITPNPADEYFAISIKDSPVQMASTDAQAKKLLEVSPSALYTISVVNTMGAQVYTTKGKGNAFNVPTSNLKDGSYIVVVSDGKNSFKKHLMVKH